MTKLKTGVSTHLTARWRQHLVLVLLLCLPLAGSADESGADQLLQQLYRGGHYIYFRHEATEWSQQDQVAAHGDWLSCDGARIRQLSDAGRGNARATGAAMQRLAIPIGPIWASPYCRTVETARLLGLGPVTPTEAVINLRVADYFGGREAIAATARQLLASPLPAGKNGIVVAHGNVARAATEVYPEEGEALIFRPDGQGGFAFIGRLSAQQWSALAR